MNKNISNDWTVQHATTATDKLFLHQPFTAKEGAEVRLAPDFLLKITNPDGETSARSFLRDQSRLRKALVNMGLVYNESPDVMEELAIDQVPIGIMLKLLELGEYIEKKHFSNQPHSFFASIEDMPERFGLVPNGDFGFLTQDDKARAIRLARLEQHFKQSYDRARDWSKEKFSGQDFLDKKRYDPLYALWLFESQIGEVRGVKLGEEFQALAPAGIKLLTQLRQLGSKPEGWPNDKKRIPAVGLGSVPTLTGLFKIEGNENFSDATLEFREHGIGIFYNLDYVPSIYFVES